ncbi:MAG: methylglyoxal synthase [Flavobacteriales bacterium]|nr:methylglyoxal synthase [Flavobacteriales bacterium]
MTKKIALVAHDSMKPQLVEFMKEREDWFWGRELVATGLTGEFLERGELKVSLTRLLPGNQGGYKQMTSLVANGEVEIAFFLRDPEIVQDYEDEVADFIRECNRKNVPLATNPASAELLIIGLIRKEAAEKARDRMHS